MSNTDASAAKRRSTETGDRDGTDSSDGEAPPGPDGWPVIGNTLQFVRDPFAFYDDLASYGDVVRYRLAGQTWTTLLHPDHVERVLVEDAHRFERYNFEEFGPEFAPEGLLMTRGERWRRQRELIQPAFTPAKVAAFADAIVDRTVDAVEDWTDGETIAANREFSGLTLEILTKTLFDLDLDDRRDAVTAAARELNERGDSRRLSAFLPMWVPTPGNLRYKRRMRRFDEAVETLIAERRAAGGDDRDDLLSTLLDAEDENGAALSDAEVRDQLVTFLFAGHETSSLALTYAVLLLARHDGARARLESEVDRVCPDRDPTIADLSNLEYAGKVVDEAMRLYPPAFVQFREAIEDVTIDGYRIPEGSKISLPQFRLHVDDRFYDDPDEFRPERWTDEMRESLPEYAYFPFGGGPRHCVAMRFARMELQLVLATIARRVRFDLESDPDPELKVAATLAPVEDVLVTVRER
ncbi:cytochrome P450 [Halosolutus gelatinilyticus]|uniref:cytochrome P450 n=1 Tax=Halosolutus gelatinilyticus TaxID=2931975 RepID=UPI001FF33657|nr:cytochrome P450 [Halosolutus gelatinilyticus]